MSELLSAIFGIFLGAFARHLLSRDSARTDRIRSARVKIRGWIDQIAAAHPGYLFQSHEAISAEVASMKNALVDDLRFWKKGGFARACSAFIDSTDEECRPVVTPSPMTGRRSEEDQKRETENWLKPGKLLASRLESVLKRI